MKNILALWQFGRGSRTIPGVPLRKRSILCNLVFAGASLFYLGQSYAVAQDINSGLAGYWPCSDINDNTLADSSGNGHNGAFTGHPIWTVGKLTGALRFDGQTEYVSTASNVVDTSQSFTAAAWVQLENELGYSTAFSQDGANVSGFYLQFLSPTDSGLGSAAGKFAFALLNSDSTGASPARAVSPFAPVTNTWYHLAGVYDSVNQVIKLYVNGSLVATQSVPAAWSATGPAAIGRGKFGQPSDFWPGRIADARLYSRALSDQDVRTLYQTAPADSPIRPPAVPLIVRGPYINTWQASDSGPGNWPAFWNGHITAFTGIARVDGTAYTFFGAPSVSGLNNQLQQIQLEVTPTQSRYVFQGGGITVYLTFLSPVDATDIQRLSMPFGYIIAQAETNDGNTHNVSLYFDISGEWANGNDSALINWSTKQVTHAGGTLQVHTVTPASPQVLTEFSDYPSWGTVVWATNSQTGFTWQSGADATVRGQAISQGFLTDTVDSNHPRAINNNWPVFAFNFQFNGLTGQPTSPVVLALGHIRTPAVSYLGKNLPPLWSSYWANWQNMLSFAYDDVASSAALNRADTLDSTISAQATQANGPHYAGLAAIALRQAFGGVELVGTSSRPWLFLKEISSSGNVSTVDVIYPGIPAFLYTNPYLVQLLLDPVLAYTESGKWPLVYCLHDLGASYPNATGHNDGGGENMPIEESANMLLMTAAAWYAQQEQPYGIPLDIRHTYTKADWEMWTAASTDDLGLRQNIVDALYDFANTSPSRVPFTDWYDTISDTQNGFQARPVIGGIYSILARLNSGN